MNEDFVLDCSVTMTWFFVHEATEATDELLERLTRDATAIVPEHWRLEVGKVLLVAERTKGKTRSDTEHFLSLLNALAIETDVRTDRRAHAQILSLARDHRLTTYDAAYLDLAMVRGLPLASLDMELRAAAKKLGVRLLPAKV